MSGLRLQVIMDQVKVGRLMNRAVSKNCRRAAINDLFCEDKFSSNKSKEKKK
jgi:hypothetical protein